MREKLRGLMQSKLQQLGLRDFFEKAEAGKFDHGSIKEPEPPTKAQIIQMPFWPEPARAAPSDILRSALFGISKKGKRLYFEREELASWKGTSIAFTGKRLDQWDEDVWLQSLHLYRQQELPSKVFCTNRSFLKEIGRSGDGRTIAKLHDSLERLVACAITLKTPEHLYQGSLLSGWAMERETGRLMLSLNKEVAQLFEGNISRINWEIRKALKTDLAKWLYAYTQTHKATKAQPHRATVSLLRELCGSTASLKSFRYKLKAACEQLKASKIVDTWSITPNDALEFVRPERTLKALASA